MSGGRPSGPQTAVGDHPSCTSNVRTDGETAGCARSRSEGLGLDGGGVADPNKKKKEVSQSGWDQVSVMEVTRSALNWIGQTALIIFKKVEIEAEGSKGPVLLDR